MHGEDMTLEPCFDMIRIMRLQLVCIVPTMAHSQNYEHLEKLELH